MDEVTVDKVISLYLTLRRQKEEIEAAAEASAKGIKANMAKLEAWLLDQAQTQKVTSFKTAEGTAFLQTTDFAGVADWNATLEFIKANGTFEMLEHRVSKRAIRDYIKANGKVPDGINYGTRIDVQVRSPAPKGE